MKVKNLTIREILATNVQKTIEVELETAKGTARSSVPIGTSKGKYEVVSLPIEDVIRKFLLIRRDFTTKEFSNQEEVDHTLRLIDKTPNFKEIGGNLALAISSVFLKAFAMENGLETFESLLKKSPTIPRPVCNVAGGWASSGLSDVQEFLLLPLHQKSFRDSISKIATAYWDVAKSLGEKDRDFIFGKNLESAWATGLDAVSMLEILAEIANRNLLMIGLDFAASQLWDGQCYVYKKSGFKNTRTEQLKFIEKIARKYPIHYIEDPFREDDFVGFSTLTHILPNKMIVGDDLFSTNLERLKEGIEHKAANSIIIKPNQIGTISDVMKVVEEAKKNNMTTVISHRSGETEDTLICHLGVGLNCDFIKLGIGGERTTKINEMIRIEEQTKK